MDKMVDQIKENGNNINPDKILWLSIIQGYAILLVVIGHVNGFTYRAENEMYPLATMIHKICYSFHMPLFMFVSGGLLYLTRINRGWHTMALYRDKMKRLLIPYIVFISIGFVLKVIFSGIAKDPIGFDLTSFFNAYFDPNNGPLKEMWFVGTLMWLMFCYPLYRVMLKNPWTELLLLLISLVPFIYGVHLNVDGWFNVAGITRYAFYFISGILFFKYDVIKYFETHIWTDIVFGLAYVAMLVAGPENLRFVTATLGILFTFAIMVRVTKIWPNLFSSFRDYSFQIFLIGIFPQMLIELVVWSRFHSEWLLIPFYLLSVLLALFSGVLLGKLGRIISWKPLRWSIGLK